MGFLDFFGKIPGPQESRGVPDLEDYVDLEVRDAAVEADYRSKAVKVCKLKGFADVDVVARELSSGNIVILDIKPLAERSTNELKHAIDEIKDIVLSMGGQTNRC